ITKPMPSMPVSFYNDPDGSRLHNEYFADYPGIWRHGDWIMITSRGSAVIYGRSDSTLNRGGIRMGSAEVYRVVENLDGLADALPLTHSTGARAGGSSPPPATGEVRALSLLVFTPTAPPADLGPASAGAINAAVPPPQAANPSTKVPALPRAGTCKNARYPSN